MPTALKQLEVDEISVVDRGANQGAKTVLVKRDFSDDERKDMASKGEALPDGSFPIKTREDLKNAIQAFGRAKNKDEAKAHIEARAKTLGATDDLLPDDWKIEKASLSDRFRAATDALRKSLHSIFAGSPQLMTGDESLTQFAASMSGAIAAVEAAPNGDIAKQENMNMDELQKALAEIATLKAAASKTAEEDEKKREEDEKMKKALAKAHRDIAILKMSDKHKDYHGKLSGDAADKFADMAPEERDDYISANPIEKALPADVQKRLDEAETLRKRVETLEKADELVKFGKRATEIGLPESFAEVLQKAHKGDTAAVTKLEDTIKALSRQVEEAGLFKEFGNRGSDENSPVAKMDALVAELQKADPKLTRDQCVAKIAATPAHAPVWKAYKAASASPAV